MIIEFHIVWLSSRVRSFNKSQTPLVHFNVFPVYEWLNDDMKEMCYIHIQVESMYHKHFSYNLKSMCE